MINIMRSYLAVLGFQILFISGPALALAQVDPTKVLVGTWEGQVQVSKQMGRTLTINSVKAQGEGEWVARGRFAVAGMESEKTTGGSEMSVSSKDNEIYIEFTTGNAKTPYKLKLVGENKLEGTADFGGKTGNRRVTLEKVAPKAGDVK